MDILIVDPANAIASIAGPQFEARGWRTTIVTDLRAASPAALASVPDAILLHGDGATGEVSHLCQLYKHNPLTAGIPVMLIEDAVPPAWVLHGLPVDAVTQSPWQAEELIHHVEVLAPTSGTGILDDLTNFPRRRSVITELERRMAAHELFGAGLLSFREADAYRQDHGRTGLDQFVVLISVLLRRNAANGTPISIGYLDEGVFLLLGAPSNVHEVLALSIRDFETLVPAFYEMDALFGNEDPQSGPPTWVSVQSGVCLVEPGRFDNAFQIGFVLAENIALGNDVIRDAAAGNDGTDEVAAD